MRREDVDKRDAIEADLSRIRVSGSKSSSFAIVIRERERVLSWREFKIRRVFQKKRIYLYVIRNNLILWLLGFQLGQQSTVVTSQIVQIGRDRFLFDKEIIWIWIQILQLTREPM
jgi:hypothetical protein